MKRMSNFPAVVVIGGVNLDIGGKPDHSLIERDSNPGRVWQSIGGVGFNIACNLALLDVPVTFLTACGTDTYGTAISRACENIGIDISRALITESMSTSVYLFIADEQGEMRLAISDMEICSLITPEYLARSADLLKKAEAVVLDTNIPEESIQWLTEHCKAPLFVDPVSVAKSSKLKDTLDGLHTLKPNRLEAELLSGVHVRSDQDLKFAADALLSRGLRRVFVSLGSEGVFAAEQGQYILLPCRPATSRNTTGAGDAFMAGLVYSHLHGYSLEEAARTASAAAAIAVESSDTINPALSVQTLYERLHS